MMMKMEQLIILKRYFMQCPLRNLPAVPSSTGVANPGLLRKVIVTEAAKVIQDASRNWKLSALTVEGESMPRMALLTEGSATFRSPSKSWKFMQMAVSPHHALVECRGMVPGELILQKMG